MIPTEEQAKTISKWPMAVLVFLVVVAISAVAQRLFSTEDNRIKDCIDNNDKLIARIEFLEERENENQRKMQDFVRTVLFQKAQLNRQADLVGEQTMRIDSLRKDIQ